MPAEPQPLLPSLRLDELLDELQVRLQAVLSTRDRVYALLEAVVAVGSNLDLDALLRTFVETAISLVDARYGAMGVLDENGQLAEFIPVGLSQQEIAAIDHWPQGKGLLGLLITEAKPLLIDDIAGHPASSGFPAGHPPMTSFLGVPIRVRGEVYGNLYLTEKLGGAGRFDSDDQAVATALAAAAGVAIENARLYEEARRQQRWVSATAEVTKELLSGAEPDEALTMISELALEMTGVDLVVVLLPTGADAAALRVEHAAGHGADEVLGLALGAGSSLLGTVLATGERLTIADVNSDERIDAAARKRLRLGAAVAVPLGGPGQVRGVLVAGRSGGGQPLSAQAAEMLATFAAQAAIAIQLAEHRRRTEQMAVFEDRDRIARDLHDLVIQRLYATGMSLQGALPLIARPEVGQRIERAVDALDETIREIRSAIFALQTRGDGSPASLRARILSVTSEISGALGFAPSLRLDGVLDSVVPQQVADDLLSALREALSNAARHAGAHRVEVTVSVDDQLVLTVRDDGVGIPAGGRRSGLRNLEHRAAALGGELVVAPAAGGGTELRWQVPLVRD
jgi:signal transduction histidine kinase